MENRENLHHKILIYEMKELIARGKKSGTIHRRDLKALLSGWEMTEEDWANARQYLQDAGIRVAPEEEGGSLFFPEPEELMESFREDAPALEYLRELQRNGIDHCMDPEQEAVTIRNRGHLPKAEELMVDGNLLRVVSIARQYVGQGMIPLDLFSEGNQGLIDAVKIWHPEDDCPITLYLIHHIRRSIRAALACVSVRPPQLTSEVLEAVRILREQQTDAEAIRRRQNSRLPVVGENPILFQMKQMLVDLQDELNPREAEVLRLRLGLTDGVVHSLDEVAEHFGITRERARQIENRVLRAGRRIRMKKRIRDFYNEA